MAKSADELKDAERRELYQAIGHFIFEFSQLEFLIRNILAVALKISDEHVTIMTSPYDFATLCRVTVAAYRGHQGLADETKKQLEAMLKEALALNDHRVRIAHGYWVVGPAGSLARHVSRQSLTAKEYFARRGELKELGDQLDGLSGRILELLLG
jgi:hypothetical protein